MKSTGIVRKVDELGRVVLPIELRRSLGIQVRDPIEIFVDEERIIMQKYTVNNACLVTGEISVENIELPGGQYLSPKGREILKSYL
jgi:transcriptional pleiotropic regulator of transition state genes